jgi:ABC-type phosphate transport system substrate-binding protein
VPVVPDASAAIPDGGVSCFSLTQGPAGGPLPKPIIYAAGSTAIQPYMGRVAQVLESLGIGSVVYLGSGSCLGVDAMLDGTPLQEVAIANSPATPPSATYYDSQLNNGALQSGTCYIDNSTVLPDLGVSDVFPTTCDPQLISQGGLPNSLHDFFGPVQTMELVVPISSSQLSISAEAAYMVWGFGAASGVSPWTDPGFLLDRAPSSGTQNMIAQTIGVPAAQWLGSPQQSSGAIVTAITNVSKGDAIDGGPGDPSDVNKTMGILASDVADSNRQYLKPLAFQDVGQACGWYPDSTGASFDKQNVRDGHYPIWGPSHLVAAVDGSGNPTNPAVKNVIDTLNGANTAVTMTLDVIQFYASSHIVPQCAMHVQRAQDGHDYSPYTPAVSCSCYYDLQATGQTTCQKCTLDSDCADAGASDTCQKFGNPPVGYCEPPGSGQ